MTRQWCVPSHEGSVLFGTSSVRCRRTDVKREPLVGQPSTAPQIDFFADLFGTLQIMLPKMPSKEQMDFESRVSGAASKILLRRFARPCDGGGSLT